MPQHYVIISVVHTSVFHYVIKSIHTSVSTLCNNISTHTCLSAMPNCADSWGEKKDDSPWDDAMSLRAVAVLTVALRACTNTITYIRYIQTYNVHKDIHLSISSLYIESGSSSAWLHSHCARLSKAALQLVRSHSTVFNVNKTDINLSTLDSVIVYW